MGVLFIYWKTWRSLKVSVSANWFGKIKMFGFSGISLAVIAVACVEEQWKLGLFFAIASTFEISFLIVLIFAVESLVVHYKNFRLQLQSKSSSSP